MRRTLFIVMTVFCCACFVTAQVPRNERHVFTAKGNVLNRKGNPFAFALVYLKDTRSRMLRIKHADRDGHFLFAWLDARLDYEIYAERDDLISEKQLISGSGKAAEVIVNLTLSKKYTEKH